MSNRQALFETSIPDLPLIGRGKVLVEDGELQVERGNGDFVPRRTIDCTGMPGRLAPELDPGQNFGVKLDI